MTKKDLLKLEIDSLNNILEKLYESQFSKKEFEKSNIINLINKSISLIQECN